MTNTKLSYRVHRLAVRQSDALDTAIAQGLAQLEPYSARIAHCAVHVGRWVQHHEAGACYRVTLELTPEPGTAPVTIECESGHAGDDSQLLPLLSQAFARAARRLAAREQTSPLSAEARRLHPLHGLAREDLTYTADEA